MMNTGAGKEGRLYPIACAPHDFLYAGTVSGERQVLIGISGHHLAGVFFDRQGNFIEVQERRLPGYNSWEHVDHDDPRVLKVLHDWQEELGFTAATIKVRRFDVPGQGIGIEDRPEHFEAFLKDPERVEPDEVTRARDLESIRRWEREGMYVLWWGRDLWMDGNGEVEST